MLNPIQALHTKRHESQAPRLKKTTVLSWCAWMEPAALSQPGAASPSIRRDTHPNHRSGRMGGALPTPQWGTDTHTDRPTIRCDAYSGADVTQFSTARRKPIGAATYNQGPQIVMSAGVLYLVLADGLPLACVEAGRWR